MCTYNEVMKFEYKLSRAAVDGKGSYNATMAGYSKPHQIAQNQLTTCNILLLNKLIVFQIDKKFPALYVTRSPSLRSQ